MRRTWAPRCLYLRLLPTAAVRSKTMSSQGNIIITFWQARRRERRRRRHRMAVDECILPLKISLRRFLQIYTHHLCDHFLFFMMPLLPSKQSTSYLLLLYFSDCSYFSSYVDPLRELLRYRFVGMSDSLSAVLLYSLFPCCFICFPSHNLPPLSYK